ncbi:helix-turn-helix domain-containing protein [Vibrio aestuarianus]|uniref:Helix-turn-helix domain-containing protein n=1 Tax=Vibrio aestuarianus TaxID=28171 RepID=A0A9X4FHQ6_9VIBR|nr:helix-turn-helix domain-containing protein [Vibrio aestuarianus]EGQ9302261.1 helix-turn-helix domain-containing protein [Vibrio vulnificus]EGR0088778.1 helix-turn-helix domain-containing protein [Vibrio vulnificus]EHY0959136.1 helix-turn-helix domain-containing protein [Vibrio vulnificus]EIO3969997.1 helix-turn-helix domain-containing protein [Vibrio vulnificus]EIO4078889.1 helix-turn-helix domain-containing protein [Vibrio vulnificus]
MRFTCTAPKPLQITALLFDGMPTTSISGPIEMLTVASTLARIPEPKINLVSTSGNSVQALGGIRLSPNRDWSEISDTDVLLIGSCGEPEKLPLLMSDEMGNWLKKLIKETSYVVSLCTGAFILAHFNVLNRKTATTHWVHSRLFRDLYPKVKLQAHIKITREDNLICTSSVGEYYQAIMLVIDGLFGSNHKEKCAHFLKGEVTEEQQVSHSDFVEFRQHNDQLIHALQDWMHEQNPTKLSVVKCASHCFLSERQMKRRFKMATGETPINYIQRIRIALAREKLNRTEHSIERICNEIGYNDTNHFRALFKKYQNMTPTEYRKSVQCFSESNFII